ncbi:MAG TPA: hypothetical protein VFA20_19145 [Myxococcaceae bacterium]|nr:hypothetical protein [Myxococcaceae bacterium]
MPGATRGRIFISHSHADGALVEAVREQTTRLRPLVFQLPASEFLPTLQRIQARRGDDPDAMSAFMMQLLGEDFGHLFTKKEAVVASWQLVKAIPAYSAKVEAAWMSDWRRSANRVSITNGRSPPPPRRPSSLGTRGG